MSAIGTILKGTLPQIMAAFGTRPDRALADRIQVVGDDQPITTRQKRVLHAAARFDTACLVVIEFGRRLVAMAEQAGGDANVFWIIDRDAGGSGISEEVRVDRLSQCFSRACDNADVDRIIGHREAVHRQPKRL